MNSSSGIIDNIMGAFIASIVQVVITAVLTTWTQFSILIAIIIALPITIIIYITLKYLYNRYTIVRKKDDLSKPQVKSEFVHPSDIKSPNVQDELITNLKEIGIVNATSQLAETKYEPAQCMKQVRKRLFFMGLLGSKWVTPANVRSDFVLFLKRVQALNGEVRFMLIDPKSQYFKDLMNLRGGALSDDSLKYFLQLSKEYSCLQVRLYNQMPCFRLIFIDDKILAISCYKIEKEGYVQSKFGWSAPHLVIDSNSPWSLYISFELYYGQIWDSAKDIKSVNCE